MMRAFKMVTEQGKEYLVFGENFSAAAVAAEYRTGAGVVAMAEIEILNVDALCEPDEAALQ